MEKCRFNRITLESFSILLILMRHRLYCAFTMSMAQKRWWKRKWNSGVDGKGKRELFSQSVRRKTVIPNGLMTQWRFNKSRRGFDYHNSAGFNFDSMIPLKWKKKDFHSFEEMKRRLCHHRLDWVSLKCIDDSRWLNRLTRDEVVSDFTNFSILLKDTLRHHISRVGVEKV